MSSVFTYVPKLCSFHSITGTVHSIFSFLDTYHQDWGKAKKVTGLPDENTRRPICTHTTVLSWGREHALLAFILQRFWRACPKCAGSGLSPATMEAYPVPRMSTDNTAQQVWWPKVIRSVTKEREEKEENCKINEWPVLGTWTEAASFTYEDTGAQVKPLAYRVIQLSGVQRPTVNLDLPGKADAAFPSCTSRKVVWQRARMQDHLQKRQMDAQ